MSSTLPSLLVRNLGFSYPRRFALQHVNIEIPPGRFAVLLGANGAGKTTLFSLLTRLYNPHSGSIAIVGSDLHKQTRKALTGMGVVFQRSTLDMDLSVQQNLRYHAALHGLARGETRTRIDDVLAKHDLSGFLRAKVGQLSGGQRRRVELARALIHQPRLLLMDEATVGLDMQSRGNFIAHVRKLCVDEQIGVLWATHLIDEVGDDDQVIIMQTGKVIAHGMVSEVIGQSCSDNIGDAFAALTGTISDQRESV